LRLFLLKDWYKASIEQRFQAKYKAFMERCILISQVYQICFRSELAPESTLNERAGKTLA
jgi:hypothetical protein